MATSFAVRQYRALFLLYLGFLTVALAIVGLFSLHTMNSWAMGDWLINYRAGFVRRGLTGEAAMRTAPLLHLAPATLVLLVQFACYMVLFFCIYRLLARSSWKYWVLLTLVSPATLSFPVLDPAGAFRKEILLFAGLGVLLLMLLGPVRDATLTLYTSLLALVCVLSHEALLVFLLYLFGALAIGLNSIWRAVRIGIVPAIATVLSMVEVVQHHGDMQTARTICGSLGYTSSGTLPPPCQGAIAYLGQDQASVRQGAISYAGHFHHASLYPVVTLLAILPIVLAFIVLWRQKPLNRQLLILATTALTSIAASSVLFLYAVDWGRWIYIHVVCISLLLLFIDSRHPTESPSLVSARAHTSLRRITLIGGFLLFALCWDLPHIGGYPLRFGFADAIRLLVHAG